MFMVLVKLEEIIVDHVIWDGGAPEHGSLRVHIIIVRDWVVSGVSI